MYCQTYQEWLNYNFPCISPRLFILDIVLGRTMNGIFNAQKFIRLKGGDASGIFRTSESRRRMVELFGYSIENVYLQLN